MKAHAAGALPADTLDIFLACPPGLESVLADEARALGFADPRVEPGGVATRGGWPEVWRANLMLRCAGRVLARVGVFRALHLAQLDKRAHRIDWASVLAPGSAVRVDAACQGSRIWHEAAAAQRIAQAIRDKVGAPRSEDAPVRVLARIIDDLCTISLDTSGEPLHRRGFKLAVGKAPLRETLAAAFLRCCGYTGAEPVVDPMCGSGAFVIEAAEMASSLAPGRGRAFAFEALKGFDAPAWAAMRAAVTPGAPAARCCGFDRDAGAIEAATANAARAGVTSATVFACQPITALTPPQDGPGLVMVNPPYGERIGDRAALFSLYGALGRVLRERFGGWRVGLVTTDAALAQATGLPFGPPGPPLPHGPLKIRLWRAGPL